jgi:hypothetical protein
LTRVLHTQQIFFAPLPEVTLSNGTLAVDLKLRIRRAEARALVGSDTDPMALGVFAFCIQIQPSLNQKEQCG